MTASGALQAPGIATSAAPCGLVLPPRLRPDARLGVLDITKYFGTTSGGIKTYLLEKARFVASRPDLRQVMVIPGAEDSVESIPGSRIYRLKGPRIPANEPYRFLFATRSLRRILEHERPDIIEVGSPLFVPWLAKLANRRLGAPMVWYCHGNLPRLAAPPGVRPVLRSQVRRAATWYVRTLGRQFPLVLCGSDAVVDEMRHYGVPNVARAPLGVDLTLFTPGRKRQATATRERLGLPDEPFALYAGRFALEKQVEVVLDAWAEVETRVGVRLVLVGAGPQAERLRAHPYANRVTWLPFERDRHQLADLLAAASFYVAPGPYETFGLSVLEAIASGTPVLAVDAGGGGELVQRSGAGARYVPGSAPHAADAAVWLAKQNLAHLGGLGRRFAEEHHGWETTLARLFAIYEQVIGTTGTGAR